MYNNFQLNQVVELGNHLICMLLRLYLRAFTFVLYCCYTKINIHQTLHGYCKIKKIDLHLFYYARNRYNAGHHPYLHKHDRSFYDEDTIWLILESWKIEECNGFEQKFLFNRNFVENIPQIQKCTSLSPEIQANNQQKHGNKLSKNLQTVISLTSWLFSKQSKISTRPNNWYVKRNSYINLFYAVIANFISLVLCYIVMIKNSSKKCFFFIEY